VSNFSVLYQNQPIGLSLPQTDLSVLPARLSKKLWVSPAEFIALTNAVEVAEWALPFEQLLASPLTHAATPWSQSYLWGSQYHRDGHGPSGLATGL